MLDLVAARHCRCGVVDCRLALSVGITDRLSIWPHRGCVGGIPGLGGVGNAARIKQAASEAMEVQRKEIVASALERLPQMTDREKLMLIRGVTQRVAEQLEQAGYRSVDSLYAEADTDRLSIKTGLDARRAAMIREGIVAFVEHESKGE